MYANLKLRVDLKSATCAKIECVQYTMRSYGVLATSQNKEKFV